MMRLWRALQAAFLQARRRGIAAAVTVTISAITAGGVVHVMSEAIHRAEGVAADLSTASARSVTITAKSAEEQPLPGRVVAAIAQFPAVLHAVAFGSPASIQNASFPAARVTVGLFTVRTMTGDDPYNVTSGRHANIGEVNLSKAAARTLSVGTPQVGSIRTPSQTLATVGTYTTAGFGDISELLDSAAITGGSPEMPIAIVSLVVRNTADVATVVAATIRLLRYLPVGSYQISYDDRAADVERIIREGSRRDVRAVALGLLALGAVTAALSSFVSALTRRRDIARQRALGRTRLEVVATAVLHATSLAVIGSSVGVVGASIWLRAYDIHFEPQLLLATAVVATVVQALAVLPGAAFGALQDPAAILRVP